MVQKVRYAVAGLGHIAQTAMLPAFKNAKNSELTALISSDPVKLKKLGKQYKVEHCYAAHDFETALLSSQVHAIYLALPNSLHWQYAERAARMGVHVLCEKPMALTERECQAMLHASRQNKVKLMVGYRLHFDRANMKAVELAHSGAIGDLRLFSSTFTMQVTDKNNIRLKQKTGGGPLYDIGLYCINAARYLFRDEPLEVMAIPASSDDRRFNEVDEMVSVIMKFPQERLATFTCSFGAADVSYYEVVGTKGSLCLDRAYEYAEGSSLDVAIGEKTSTHEFAKHDQFGAELTYFSDCILKNLEPEPSGLEGWADVRIVQALEHSLRTGRSVRLDHFELDRRPGPELILQKPAFPKPETIHSTSPT